jgi:hypothetical protein
VWTFLGLGLAAWYALSIPTRRQALVS